MLKSKSKNKSKKDNLYCEIAFFIHIELFQDRQEKQPFIAVFQSHTGIWTRWHKSSLDYIYCLYVIFNYYYFFFFLGPHQWHMEVSRLGVEAELRLPGYTTATAMPDPSPICELRCSSGKCWILNPLREARDGTHILTDSMSDS